MGWGYQSFYPPYVPVAKRRADAAKEVAKRQKSGQKLSPVKIEGLKITKSFWGNAWCQNLEAYSDYANRLPRGRTYVRNGSVIDLQLEKGLIKALVSGSEIYESTITITELMKTSWNDIKQECAGQIGSLVELLQGKLSKQVMEIVTRRDSGLFPKPREIKMRCSCPDSAGLCKHLAAVMYGVGARLDLQPELLFQLRHVDHLELIDGAGKADLVGKQTTSGKKTINTGDLADMFGIEMADSHQPEPVASGSKKSTKPKRTSEPRTTTSSVTAKVVAAPTTKAKSGAAAKSKTGTSPKAVVSQVATKPARKSPAQSKTSTTSKTTAKSPVTTAKDRAEPKPRTPKPPTQRKSKSTPSIKSLARNKAASSE